MARPRLFSFFNRAPDATALIKAATAELIPPPFSVTTGLQSEPPDSDVATLTAEVARLKADRDQIHAAYTAGMESNSQLRVAIETLKAEAATINESLTAAIAERDTLKAESARTREDLTQELRNQELATLAASQGIPAGAELVPANPQPEPTISERMAALTEKLAACTSPTERFELSKQARALVK